MADYQSLDPRHSGGPQILGAAGSGYSSAHAGALFAASPLYLHQACRAVNSPP